MVHVHIFYYFYLNVFLQLLYQYGPQHVQVKFFIRRPTFRNYQLNRTCNIRIRRINQLLNNLELLPRFLTPTFTDLILGYWNKYFYFLNHLEQDFVQKAISEFHEWAAGILKTCNVRVDNTIDLIVDEVREESFRHVLTVANVKYAQFLFLVYDKFVLILADSLWIFYSHLVQSVSSVNQRR